ncbi:MAG: NAD(P)-dependent oxidoreductase [Candidatus Bathyarchaeia archaeon]
MIGERELRSMKKTAFIVNTARGAIIDEKRNCQVQITLCLKWKMLLSPLILHLALTKHIKEKHFWRRRSFKGIKGENPKLLQTLKC